MTNLTAQQAAGIQKIRDWYQSADGTFGADVFRLFGPAGTGKTTMAKAIPEALGIAPDNVRYGTFTGKAAHVLRSKGAAPVSTIHSGIYFPTQDAEAVQRLRDAQAELADLTSIVTDPESTQEHAGHAQEEIERLEQTLPGLQADARRVSFELNAESEWASASLIILDEVSMVGPKLAQDIESYGVPILVLGDPAQLPPVDGGGYYTEATPDFLLTEIHRQALESPVLELATRVRLSTGDRLGLTPADLAPASVRAALKADQVLTWSNKRRWALITAMRKALERPAGQVVPGDRIMCLTNNKNLAVFNGQQFEVLEVQTGDSRGPVLRLLTDEDQERLIQVHPDGFQGQKEQQDAKDGGMGVRKGQPMLATYANAITVHKAQGSEWGHVYVVNETEDMMWASRQRRGKEAAIREARQWLYTAATRASDQLTITRPKRH